MNILNKLSLINLKLNKKRTISTIIGIILSCALICGTATLATSFQETLVQSEINRGGYYHLQITGATDEDIENFKNSRDVKDVLRVYENGYGKYENAMNENYPYLKVSSMSNSLFKYLKFNIVEGRFPKNDKEIIINQNAKNYVDSNLKVGNKITLKIGQRQSSDGEILGGSNPIQEDETLINTKTKEFTIVGIMERPDFSFENYNDPGYTAITTDSDYGTNRVFIVLQNPKDYKGAISRILGVSDYRKITSDPDLELKYEDVEINSELLGWEAWAFGDSTVQMMYTVVAIIIGIIMVTSIFCIKNSISISVTEKLKMYGMLSSVGATKEQIKKNVIFEALILGLIGIPLGIIGGLLGIYVLIYVVNLIGGDTLLANINGIVFKTSSLAIIFAAILSFITLYLSAVFPARTASKTAPLDLIRNPEKVKLKARKLKVPKIISKIFKVGGELAYKNLKRSKRKYRTTVVSITISIAVFIIMNSFVGNVFDFTSEYYKDVDYNIRISYLKTQEDIDKVENMQNTDSFIEVYGTHYSSILLKDMSKINSEYIDKVFNRNKISEEIDGQIYETLADKTGKDDEFSIYPYVVAFKTKEFNEYVKKIGEDPKKMKGKIILNGEYNLYSDDKIVKVQIYEYSKGDTFNAIYYNYNADEINKEDSSYIKYDENDLPYIEKPVSFEVGAITKVKPFGNERNSYQGGFLVLNVDDFPELNLKLESVLIQSNDPEAFDEEIKQLDVDLDNVMGHILGYDNIAIEVKEQKSMVLIVKIFLYGFIAVITLIGVTNIFNTITSNMELRQREFASLKSIGMTKKEFNRMLNLETIFYSVKSLFYGLILGLLGTFYMYKAFSIKIVNNEVYIPYSAIIISVVAVFILVFAIMRYSIKKINKQNIIETIRKENI